MWRAIKQTLIRTWREIWLPERYEIDLANIENIVTRRCQVVRVRARAGQ